MNTTIFTQKCSRCGSGRYNHQNHVHNHGIGWPNPCPFGDCGEFQP